MADRYLVVNVSHDHGLASFGQLACAHCSAGPSDLVHLVVKIVGKAGSKKIFMLVTFFW